MDDLIQLITHQAIPYRVIAITLLAITAHVLVVLLRLFVNRFLLSQPKKQLQKLKSFTTLTSSALAIVIYFFSLGLILQEIGITLSTYFASVSFIGLAVGFGAQGVVQDIVTGLTLVFSDLIDVGDLVEISGQTGMVQSITLRFVQIENALGATVYIPNRTIANITNYPRGYIRCLLDVTLRGDDKVKSQIKSRVQEVMSNINEQFPGILITAPSVEGHLKFKSGKEVLRLKFRIWPNRGGPIETTFSKELTAEIKRFDAEFQDWMIAVSYEAEERKSPITPRWSWNKVSTQADKRNAAK
ncbi:mechanosensitive ion channel domain-containing protein [Aliiglaciecola sp. LCG003]|uniref:mechanosensitive ion channel family protein n=1 Tax=Aliiglaciecola sp. LCG003 TaxID=3053655 RepID=UPI0025746F7C|nr:mechanosensitive ion channel domain-containing protein [Aliiglaciecola sp. LCG003]WJG07637.1 mechanosensitive ion channel [Aliiglaciecola sp. LCG003]